MEKPYRGRATIIDNIIDLQISIPAKRNWFLIIFIGAWLGGWLMGEIFAGTMVFGFLRGNPASLFIVFWLVAWTVGGFLAFRLFLWNLRGKELITVGQGRLTIDKKASIFFKAKTYDLNEVKNVRVQEDVPNDRGMSFGRRNDFGAFNLGGTIRFDYGFKTIKFGNGLDEAEARHIVEKLKERNLLTANNFS